MPWRPADWRGGGDPCWKLIAGVVELPEEHKPKIESKDNLDELPF